MSCGFDHHLLSENGIDGVMISVLASSVEDDGLRSCQIKEYEIGICCFSAKRTTLTRKSKDLLAQNQYNMSTWSDRSTSILLFQ